LNSLRSNTNQLASGREFKKPSFLARGLTKHSDADFTYSGPAVIANYLLSLGDPVFSLLTGERLMIIYSEKGTEGVRAGVQKVREAGAIWHFHRQGLPTFFKSAALA